jgi:predicted GNAT superfamily acetyltransferase
MVQTDAPVVRVAIPRDADAESAGRRSTWRSVTRQALTHYLALGYHVVRFHRGTNAELPCYELAPRRQ